MTLNDFLPLWPVALFGAALFLMVEIIASACVRRQARISSRQQIELIMDEYRTAPKGLAEIEELPRRGRQ